jgi:hypothetical protein
MKIITVAASKNDSHAYAVRKFRNALDVKYLRKISPDRNELTELAVFLLDHCPPVVAGCCPAFDRASRVVCYNGKTEADMIRLEKRKNAEKYIRDYDLENVPCKINDWKFDVIRHDRNDTEYWNFQAAKMLGAGVVRITIGNSEWAAQ